MVRSLTIDRIPLTPVAWGLVLITFVAGDVGTTTFGLYVVEGVVERHPVSAGSIAVGGAVVAMAFTKALVVGVAYAGNRYFVPERYRAAVPIALATFGGIIVGWNAAVIAAFV